MKTGKVKFFNESKGYGFIKDNDTNIDIFVHVSALNGTQIRENDNVTYDEKQGNKGLTAINVKKATSTSDVV